MQPNVMRAHGAIVLVQATTDAEALASKSGLTVADLLRPFTFANLSVLGVPCQLDSFTFMSMPEFEEVDIETADANMSRLLSAYDCATELAQVERSELVHHSHVPVDQSGRTPSSVIHAFREQLAGVLLRNDAGAPLDHPVCCLLVASAVQSSPVGVFDALESIATMMPVVADGFAEPGFPRSYVLLHDTADAAASASVAQSALAEASHRFGPAVCHLVSINSRNSFSLLPRRIGAPVHPRHCTPRETLADASPWLSDHSLLTVENVHELREFIRGPLARQARHPNLIARPEPLDRHVLSTLS